MVESLHRRSVFSRVSLIVAMSALLICSPSFAESPVGDPFPIQEVAGFGNLSTDVVFNPVHGEFLVLFHNVWANNTWDVYAQRVAYDGTMLSWFAVATGAGQMHYQAHAAFSPTHEEYLIVWTTRDPTDPLPAVPDHDVYGRRVSWDGSWMGGVFAIADDVDAQWRPEVVYNQSDDEYLVVYQNTWAGFTTDIAAQRIDATDGALLSWANVATGSGEFRWTPNVAHDPGANRYLIVYPKYNGGVYGKLAEGNLDGVSVAPEIAILNDPSKTYSETPGVVFGFGEFLVAWVESSTDFGARARRLSAAGTPLGPSGGIDLGRSDQAWAITDRMNVAVGPEGNYVAVWDARMIGTDLDVSLRLIKAETDILDGSRYEVSDSLDNEGNSAVDCAPFGNCLVAYSSSPFASFPNVYARFVSFAIFADRFEDGTLGHWSSVTP